uniref:7TM_GPCR_Srx domain-containing protein n=1 Tax=Heterorhabditis bacteriophora TaxID=37862 RepID=A0A1I7WEI0_HETBA
MLIFLKTAIFHRFKMSTLYSNMSTINSVQLLLLLIT